MNDTMIMKLEDKDKTLSFHINQEDKDKTLSFDINQEGTKDYNKLKNKPSINGVELEGNKTTEDLGIDQDFVKDDYYVHTDNNYTTTEKNKLSTLHNYDDTEIKAELNNKVDKVEGKGLSTNDYTDEDKTKLASLENYDDTEVKSDITNLQTNKADKSEITNFITKDVNNLTYYTLKTDTGSLIDLEINSSTYVVTLTLKDQDGNSISTDSIDLPLETVVVGGRYDSASKKVILVLENGNEIEFSVADLVAGLQTEITSNNKLASDLVDDTNSGNKFVTTSEKQTWNNKVDSEDLDDYVKSTDYATSSKGGVVKSGYNGLNVNPTGGSVWATQYTDAQYDTIGTSTFIGKGTLDNIITGRLVQKTDYGTTTDAGVVKSGNYGFRISSLGVGYVLRAVESQIDAKSSEYLPIVPSKLDYATKVGITTNEIELTNDEKNNAQKWLGIEEIVADAKGTNIKLTDSKAKKISSLTLYGKSSQTVNTGSNLTYMTDSNYVTKGSSVRFGTNTIIEDNGSSIYFPTGSVLSSVNTRFLVYLLPTEVGKWYTFQLISDPETSDIGATFSEYQPNPSSVSDRISALVAGKNISYTFQAEADKAYCVEFRSPTNGEGVVTNNPTRVKVMFNEGTPKEWEAYTGGIPNRTVSVPAPITDITSENITITDGVNTQTGTLNFPLRGIKVDDGGNYIDNEGQMWLTDSIERYKDGTGKYIQRINRINGSYIASNAGAFYGDSETKNKYVGFSLSSQPNAKWSSRINNICTNFSFATGVGTSDKLGIQIAGNESAETLNMIIGFGLDSTLTYAQRKEYVQNLTDDFAVEYGLKTPVETTLTAEQLEQLDLSMYNGETTITSNTDLKLEYVANAKKYVDNKIEQELKDRDKYVLLAENIITEPSNTAIEWESSSEEDVYDDIIVQCEDMLGTAQGTGTIAYRLSNSNDNFTVSTSNVLSNTTVRTYWVDLMRYLPNKWKFEKRSATNAVGDVTGNAIRVDTQYKDKINKVRFYTSSAINFVQGTYRIYGRKRF